jgi:hypothetical protein
MCPDIDLGVQKSSYLVDAAAQSLQIGKTGNWVHGSKWIFVLGNVYGTRNAKYLSWLAN